MKSKRKSRSPKKPADKHTTVITMPDSRYRETGVARPDDSHVKEGVDWSENHQQ